MTEQKLEFLTLPVTEGAIIPIVAKKPKAKAKKPKVVPLEGDAKEVKKQVSAMLRNWEAAFISLLEKCKVGFATPYDISGMRFGKTSINSIGKKLISDNRFIIATQEKSYNKKSTRGATLYYVWNTFFTPFLAAWMGPDWKAVQAKGQFTIATLGGVKGNPESKKASFDRRLKAWLDEPGKHQAPAGIEAQLKPKDEKEEDLVASYRYWSDAIKTLKKQGLTIDGNTAPPWPAQTFQPLDELRKKYNTAMNTPEQTGLAEAFAALDNAKKFNATLRDFRNIYLGRIFRRIYTSILISGFMEGAADKNAISGLQTRLQKFLSDVQVRSVIEDYKLQDGTPAKRFKVPASVSILTPLLSIYGILSGIRDINDGRNFYMDTTKLPALPADMPAIYDTTIRGSDEKTKLPNNSEAITAINNFIAVYGPYFKTPTEAEFLAKDQKYAAAKKVEKEAKDAYITAHRKWEENKAKYEATVISNKLNNLPAPAPFMEAEPQPPAATRVRPAVPVGAIQIPNWNSIISKYNKDANTKSAEIVKAKSDLARLVKKSLDISIPRIIGAGDVNEAKVEAFIATQPQPTKDAWAIYKILHHKDIVDFAMELHNLSQTYQHIMSAGINKYKTMVQKEKQDSKRKTKK